MIGLSRKTLLVWSAPILLAGILVLAALKYQRTLIGLTETQAIEKAAALYVAQGGRPEDCHAVLAHSKALWLVVSCRAAQAPEIVYFIDYFGTIVDGGIDEDQA